MKNEIFFHYSKNWRPPPYFGRTIYLFYWCPPLIAGYMAFRLHIWDGSCQLGCQILFYISQRVEKQYQTIPRGRRGSFNDVVRAGTLFLSFYLSVILSFCLFVFLSFCHSVFLSFCLSVLLSFCLSVFLSICLYVSVWLSITIFLSEAFLCCVMFCLLEVSKHFKINKLLCYVGSV